MAFVWRKLKKSLSKLSFHTKSAASSTAINNPSQPSVTASSPPLPPLHSTSSSTSSSAQLSHRLSRTFSLQSSSKTCAICLRSMKKGQGQAIFFAECSHSFHFNCIADNVKHGNLICPICRYKWKDVPFQAPTNVADPQRNVIGRARISPHDTLPIRPEPENFSDDEALPPVSANTTSPTNAQAVTIKSFTEYPAISASDSLPKFGVLVRICAPPLVDIHHNHRAPIDLVAVLDISGSMQGKLGLLKRAVSFIIQNLGPSDRLSIVTFSSAARRILPLRRMSDSGREDAINVINSLYASGGTNIAAGLKRGLRVLEERREHNPVSSIILLSDGCDTYSVGTNQSSNAENKVEYLKLLLASIYSSNNALQDSQQLTIPVHTFGFGMDHDSITMHAISDASGGTFSFIETIDILQDAFARCIGGLLSIVVQDVQLNVRSLSPGVQIVSIPSGKYKSEVFDQGRKAVIDIGSLYAEEEKEFLVFLSVSTKSGATNKERLERISLLDVWCLHKDSMSSQVVQVEGERVEIQRPIVLSPADQTVCLEVDRQRNRLRVTEAIADAQKMAEMGDFRGAQMMLAKQRKALLSTASAQAGDNLCNWLEAELREVKERMQSRELYDQSGRAYVLSGMSSHSWQRATTRGQSTTCPLSRNGESGATTSYETPSMVNMVSKSQILNFAPQAQRPHQLSKSCSLAGHL